MWTKNGTKTLPVVLKRIDEVIPSEAVNSRILIDDHSADDTREVAKSFGWNVFFNEGTGANSGAKTALRHIKSQHFISFEQDVLLAENWWACVPPLLEQNNVAVAQGVRIADSPFSLNRLQDYVNENYRKKTSQNPMFASGKTVDNTIYKTEIIRRIMGFPELLLVGVAKLGYVWAVNFNVKSVHLRGGLVNEIRHQYWYGTTLDEYWQPSELVNRWTQDTLKMMLSPIRGIEIAYKQRCLGIFYLYPSLRLASYLGWLKGIEKISRTKKKHTLEVTG